MHMNKASILKQLDDVLDEFQQVYATIHDNDDEFRERAVIARMRSAIRRLAPPNSEYLSFLRNQYGNYYDEMLDLAGVVRALRSDYAADALQTIRELCNAELARDYLRMAEFLLGDEKLKHPAAVLAGGVLEEHLRNLYGKRGNDTTVKDSKGNERPKKASTLNVELCKAGVYGANDQKQVTAWCGIRNSAAHAKYDEFDEAQVAEMIRGIRTFVSRYPA